MSTSTVHRMDDIELFQGCRRSQLKKLDGLGTMLVVPAGWTLCHQGSPSSQLFVQIDGLVQAQKPSGRLALMHGGAWFGEAALINETVEPASVTTVVETRVIVFDRREFTTLRDIAPQARDRLDASAARIARGDSPTSQPWYQPIVVHAPNDRMPVSRAGAPVPHPS